jgi:hypothetical protein
MGTAVRELAENEYLTPRFAYVVKLAGVAHELPVAAQLLPLCDPCRCRFFFRVSFRLSIVSTAPPLHVRSQLEEEMLKKKSFVVRSHEDGWMVQREGKKSPESTHRKKETAVRKGRSLAKRAGGVLKIKGRNGKIQARRKYAA